MSELPQGRSSRFSSGAWLVLGFALLLLLVGVAQLLYRYTLPTDGWAVYTTEIVESVWLFDRNLVGVASDLRSGDAVLAVDGVAVAGEATSHSVPPPPGWQVGQTVTMRIRRAGQQMDMPVPVVHWTAGAVWRYNTQTIGQVAFLLGALSLLAVGWFTFLRRPGVPSARALLIFCTALGATALSGTLPDGLSMQFDQISYPLTAFYSYAIFGTVLAPSLFTFSLLFPRPKRIIQQHPWLAALPLFYGLLLFVFLVADGNAEIAWYGTMGLFGLTIASLIHSWLTQRDPASRAQMRWAIFGFVLGLGMFMLNFLNAFGWVTDTAVIAVLDVFASLGLLVMGLALAVAVLRYRLYDIDVVLRKTLVYVALSALLALVYFGSVLVLQTLVGRTTGEQSPVVIVISTLLIAALFAPLRRRVQEGIDRRFFRSKVDAQAVLAQFAETARDETDVEQLTADLARIVNETMRPEGVTIWLKKQVSS